MKRRKCEKILNKLGAKYQRTSGSHQIYELNSKIIIVPHKTDISSGTLRDIRNRVRDALGDDNYELSA